LLSRSTAPHLQESVNDGVDIDFTIGHFDGMGGWELDESGEEIKKKRRKRWW